MDLGTCQWPVWQTDDFTYCFQQSYLKVAIPSLVIAVSLFVLIADNLRRAIKKKRSRGYARVGGNEAIRPNLSENHTELPADDSEDEAFSIGGGRLGRLALVKTTTQGSIIEADTPLGQTLSVVVEEIAIIGLVVASAVALASNSRGRNADVLAAIVGLTVWIYALILTSLRLMLGNTRWRVPRIWNHTAVIYFVQWLCTAVVSRSVIVHPTSQLTQVLVITEFLLTTVLFLLAITTRKGNKTILLEWEDGIQPSRENLASIFSYLTFGWVSAIMYEGWKKPLDMSKVWNLLPRDKAANVLSHYRQVKKTTALAWHLAKYFKGLLFAQIAWTILFAVVTFVPTMLLKAILEYIQDPSDTPRNVLWLYVILLPVADITRSIGQNQSLWIGRKICINSRTILIGEIYAKALRRKAAAGRDTALGGETKKDGPPKGFLGKLKQTLGFRDKKQDKEQDVSGAAVQGSGSDAAQKADDLDEQANMGTIINLMSVDSFKVSEVSAYLHFLVANAPVQLVICVVLLYRVMGLSAIPGFVVIVLLLPVNIALARGFNSKQKKIMAATDKRIQSTNEILQNIRIIKYFAWESRFGMLVDEKRTVELAALKSRFYLWAFAAAIWNTVPILITFFCFLVYTLVEGKPLYPSVAFTAISLFLLLRHPLDQIGDLLAHVQEAKVSVDRIEEFLSEEETEKFEQLGQDNVDENGNKVIGFRKATFIWGGKGVVAEDGSMAFRLLDIDIDFKIGKLNMITGPTGSGKSSLLMALLGEMTLVDGRVFLPGARSREDVRPDPATGLADNVAYAAQQPWLVNGNIKENILFSASWDERRYKDTLTACALERDLEILDHGDETLVGEKGIALSGGQKQRISLARAVYSNSRHLIMDDCLSAVDAHTAKWIFNNCIMGPLMQDRTCIMVSHNIPLCVPNADYVVVMNNGRVSTQGSAYDVIASGTLGEDMMQKSRPGSVHISRVPSRVPSSVGERSGETLVNLGEVYDNISKKDTKSKKAQEEETQFTGAVKWPVMKLYMTAMGNSWFWIVSLVVLASQQILSAASNLWITRWANRYITEDTSKVRFVMNMESFSTKAVPQAYLASIAGHTSSKAVGVQGTPAQDVDVTFYLAVLAVIGILGGLSALARDMWIFTGSVNASRKIHHRLFTMVAGAKFRFFDVTPLGQIMNRFSKDLESVDQETAPTAIGVMTIMLSLVVTVVMIVAVVPGFLVAAFFIALAYYCLGTFYLQASRDLKRLESVGRSPLFQQFGETLNGVTTIRAYGDERRFVRENVSKINAQIRPFVYMWAANRWLAFRTDFLGDTIALSVGIFIILSIGTIDAGSAGLALSYAVGFADGMLWLVRLTGENQQAMNSVERIKEYLDVEQEAEPIVEKNRPPENWPANGAVEFINYTTRYRKELDPVLKNLTFKIEAREKVGIVGRTGAGKSSLALSIFRALEAEEGKILIDHVDIGLIGLRDLREAIVMVPQEPTLFTGTIRTNLDPFEMYTDKQLFAALRRVQLVGPDESTTGPPSPTRPSTPAVNSPDGEPEEGPSSATNKNIFLNLSSPVSGSGNNLAQGQRQLLCLARAMLKTPNVLVMDEATASIDYATDAKIQETIRELDSTIITIAHRLQTIADYDKVLVLDKGRVVEYGHPWELMRNADGMFRGMCETSGDVAAIEKAAEKAFREKKAKGKLVDVDDDDDDDGDQAGGHAVSGGKPRPSQGANGSGASQ